MKRSHLAIAVVFALSILMTSAVAQTTHIKANIPFDFVVGKQTLPAGEYSITGQGMVLQLVRVDGPGSMFVQTYIAGYKNNVIPRILFHRYGKRSFLSQIWTPDRAREVKASPREVEFARADKQEQVEVLASVIKK